MAVPVLAAASLGLAAAPVQAAQRAAPVKAGVRAASSYTAYVVNNQFPTSNSVTAVTGSGSSWTPGTPLVVGQGGIALTTITFSPSGSEAYLVEGGPNQVVPIKTSSFTAGPAFSAHVTSAFAGVVTPDGKSLVVTGAVSNNVAVISLANTALARLVKVGSSPLGVAVLPNGAAAYVVNNGSGTVSAIGLTGTPKVTKTIPLPSGCTGALWVVAAPDGKTVYVTCTSSNRLWPITVATNKPAAAGIKIPTGGNAGHVQQVAITPNGTTAYVASGNDVYPVTLATKKAGKGIPMTNASSVAVSPDGAYVMTGRSDYGCGCFQDTVEVIKTATAKIVATLASGGYEHFSIAFKP